MKVKFGLDKEGRPTMTYLTDDGKYSCDAVYMTVGLAIPIDQLEWRIKNAKEAEQRYLTNAFSN